MNEDRIKAIKSLLDDIEGNQGVENRNAYVCHDMLIRCVGVLKGLVDDYCHNDSSSDVDSMAEKDSEPHAVMSLKTLVDMIAHAKSEYARIKNTELLDAEPVKVMKLREYKDTYASVTRGKVTYWLVFNWEGLKVTKEFEDFATGNYESCNMGINTKTPYEKSCFFDDYDIEILTLPGAEESPKEPETAKFEPFVSKVLVRNNPGYLWMPAFFFSEESEGGARWYHIVGTHDTYRECIPYEGNEELAFTSNDVRVM